VVYPGIGNIGSHLGWHWSL